MWYRTICFDGIISTLSHSLCLFYYAWCVLSSLQNNTVIVAFPHEREPIFKGIVNNVLC